MKIQGYLLALASGTFTGLTVAVGKMAAVHLSAALYVFLMSFISCVFMFLWRGITMGWSLDRMPRSVFFLLCLQVIFSAAALWGFWEGARQINTGLASFAARTELIFVLIASYGLFREKIGWLGLCGSFLIVAGTVVMALQQSGYWNEGITARPSGVFYGLSVVIISGLGFAASECFSKLLAHRLEPSVLVIWRCMLLSLGFGLVVLLDEGHEVLGQVSRDDLFYVSLASLLGPVLARLTFMWSLQRIELGTSYLLCQVEPIITAIAAWLLLGESLREAEVWGAALILLGCFIVASPVRINPRKILSKFAILREPSCGTRRMSVDSLD